MQSHAILENPFVYQSLEGTKTLYANMLPQRRYPVENTTLLCCSSSLKVKALRFMNPNTLRTSRRRNAVQPISNNFFASARQF